MSAIRSSGPVSPSTFTALSLSTRTESESASPSSSVEPSPLALKLAAMTRSDLVAHFDASYRSRMTRQLERRRDVADLEIEAAWSVLLEWVWRSFRPAIVRSEDHLIRTLFRVFRYALRIEIKSRGLRSPDSGRGVGTPARSIDSMHVAATPCNRQHEARADLRRRVEHPQLGSCRIDLAAAFDHLTERRRRAVDATVVRRMSQIEASEELRTTLSDVQQSKFHGLAQLRSMLEGTYLLRGGKTRYVACDEEPGFRLEPHQSALTATPPPCYALCSTSDNTC